VALDAAGNLYIADSNNSRIRKVDASGMIGTVAGNGVSGFGGDGAAAADAHLANPEDVAVDAAGNLYIADTGNNRIRKVTPDGIISTIAGTGTKGSSLSDGPATKAELDSPAGIAVDATGNVYVSDGGNNRAVVLTVYVPSDFDKTAYPIFSGKTIARVRLW
jgi:sugar lactone lactonase YvrE